MNLFEIPYVFGDYTHFAFYCGALRLWVFPYCKHLQLQVKPFRCINKCLPYNWKWKWSRDMYEGQNHHRSPPHCHFSLWLGEANIFCSWAPEWQHSCSWRHSCHRHLRFSFLNSRTCSMCHCQVCLPSECRSITSVTVAQRLSLAAPHRVFFLILSLGP